MNEINTSIADAIRKNMNITEASAALGISRPTFYKFQKSYENGDYDSIPESVKTLFDLAISGEGAYEKVTDYLAKLMHVRNERDSSRIMLEHENKIRALRNELKNRSEMLDEIQSKRHMIASLSESSDIPSLKQAAMDLAKEEGNLHRSVAELKNELNRELVRRNEMAHETVINRSNFTSDEENSSITWNDGDVISVSLGKGGRALVIFQDAMPNPETRVVVAISLENEIFEIGEYVPPKANLLIIDDLISKPVFQYNVIQTDGSKVVESGFHPLVFE